MTNYDFVLYTFKPAQQDNFRSAFARHWSGPASLTFSGVHPDHEKLAANVHTDRIVEIKTGSALRGEQVNDLFEAVKAAAHDCGSAMCPVRDEHGEMVDTRQSKFAKWKRKLHL